MKLQQIIEYLEAEVIWAPKPRVDIELPLACSADMMSDVLAFSKPDSLLLTGLTNPQVVRTAEIADIPVICFVRGKKPQRETVILAGQKGILLLATGQSLFQAGGKLFTRGMPGWDTVR